MFGLVDDQYAVVAHTPNLTREAAHELCRAVGIGDPTVPIDDALSFLEVPGWGFVCTRYATQLDARGRLALVSDSVVVDAATFRALRADPFRCTPRRGDTPDARRALDVPRFTASTPEAESERLAEARRTIDEGRELRPLLAALLAGERVLLVSPGVAPAVLQALVLLLPPSLRGRMTYQTAATRPPRHAPRLTAADRRYAELASVSWTRELPREIGVADARADAAADALLALAPAALAAGHALYESLAAAAVPDGLLIAAERVARLGAHAAAIAAGSAPDALRAIAAARDDRELATLVDLTLAAFPPATVGDALAALLAERGADAYGAGTRVVVELLRRETRDPDATEAARSLDAALAGTDRVRWAHDHAARQARAAFAVVAARRGDGERLVQLADADAEWSALAIPAAQPATAAARLTTTVVAALGHARAGDADAAVAALDAIGALAASLGAGARRDAAVLAAGVAARAVAAAVSPPAPERLRRVADAQTAFWDRVPPADARGDALRRLLAGTPDADAAARQLADAPTAERAGWFGAAALRALAARADVAPLVAALGTADDAALPHTLGALLVAAAPDGPPLGGAWPALLAGVDDASRRALLVRALVRATRDPVPLDELAATCAALADLDFRLDAAAAHDLAAPIARWAAGLPPTRAAAMRVGATLALLGELADADAAALLATAALRDASEELRALVRLRRLAAAVGDVEATRDPGAWTALRTSLRTLLRARSRDLLPAQCAALRAFLGVREKRGLLGRLRGDDDASPEVTR